MIPHYERPAAPVPTTFPGGSNQSSVAADIRWRDFFSDPRLKRLVELSLQNNRNLRVAALTVEQYRAQYRIQFAELLPTVDASGSYTRARSFRKTSTEFTASVGATSYEVDLFGRVRSLTGQALETYLASAETHRSTEITLVAQVASQYLTLLDDQEQLELARQTLISVQRSYDLTKLQFDKGTAGELDVASAEGQVHTAQASIFQYERLVAQANNYLTLLVGEQLPTDLPAGQTLEGQGTFTNLPAGLTSDLIQRRPDILSAEHTLLAANANIGAARAAFFPVITLTGSGGYTSFQLSQLFTPASLAWSFSPQISIPIFNGGSNLATLDYAVVSKRLEVANYEQVIQTAFREVADALVARDRYTFELNAQQKLVAAEQKRYDLSNQLYGGGLASYLTVLTAQQNLYTAQSGLITTRANRLGNLITLYESLGGGWN
jgi:multidrug efflux system outer membrane protein